MSRGVNKWIGIGNCCADPEARYTKSGDAVTSFTIACNETWKDRQTGEAKEKAEFVKVIFFGKPAEVIAQYCKKGAKLYVEGQIRTRKWQDNQGADKYSTEIMGREFQFLSPQGDAGQQHGQSQGQRSASPPAQRQAPATQTQELPDNNFGFDDDIPF